MIIKCLAVDPASFNDFLNGDFMQGFLLHQFFQGCRQHLFGDIALESRVF